MATRERLLSCLRIPDQAVEQARARQKVLLEPLQNARPGATQTRHEIASMRNRVKEDAMITPEQTVEGLEMLILEVDAWYDRQKSHCDAGPVGNIARDRFERGRQNKLRILRDAIEVAKEYSN